MKNTTDAAVKAKVTSTITLNNGRPVNADFLDIIQGAVEERLMVLPRGTVSTLKKICGEGFWKRLGEGEKRTAGWCMEHLVAKGQVPFEFAESRHEYPKHYRLP